MVNAYASPLVADHAYLRSLGVNQIHLMSYHIGLLRFNKIHLPGQHTTPPNMGKMCSMIGASTEDTTRMKMFELSALFSHCHATLENKDVTPFHNLLNPMLLTIHLTKYLVTPRQSLLTNGETQKHFLTGIEQNKKRFRCQDQDLTQGYLDVASV